MASVLGGGRGDESNFSVSTGQYCTAHTHSNMLGAKHFSLEDKRVAIELHKAGIPLKNIREQLQMSAV